MMMLRLMLLLFMAGMALAPAAAVGDRTVSVDLRDADVRDVVVRILNEARMDYVMMDEVRGKITAHLEGLPVDRALRVILGSVGCEAVQDNGAILVRRRKEPQAPTPDQQNVSESRGAPVSSTVESLPLSQLAPASPTPAPLLGFEGQAFAPSWAPGPTGPYTQLAPGLFIGGISPFAGGYGYMPSGLQVPGLMPAYTPFGLPRDGWMSWLQATGVLPFGASVPLSWTGFGIPLR